MTDADQPDSASGSGRDRRLGVAPPSRPRGDEQHPAQADPQTPSAGESPASRSSGPGSRGPALDIAGFTDQPDGSPSRETAATQPADQDSSPRRKTTVLLPHRLIDGVREAANRQDCILAEVIIEAYVAHGDAVRDELVDSEAAERRARMGLPPPPAPQPPSRSHGEERGQLQISVSAAALKVLDETADAVGISRSHLVEELLERHLGNSPDASVQPRNQRPLPGSSRRQT